MVKLLKIKCNKLKSKNQRLCLPNTQHAMVLYNGWCVLGHLSLTLTCAKQSGEHRFFLQQILHSKAKCDSGDDQSLSPAPKQRTESQPY